MKCLFDTAGESETTLCREVLKAQPHVPAARLSSTRGAAASARRRDRLRGRVAIKKEAQTMLKEKCNVCGTEEAEGGSQAPQPRPRGWGHGWSAPLEVGERLTPPSGDGTEPTSPVSMGGALTIRLLKNNSP